MRFEEKYKRASETRRPDEQRISISDDTFAIVEALNQLIRVIQNGR